MFELLAIVGVGAAAYGGFKLGVHFQRSQMCTQLQRANLFDAYVDSLQFALENPGQEDNMITLKLERYENGVVYAHCSETGVFLGQGTTLHELESHIAKSINSPDFKLPPADSLEDLIQKNLVN